jgi:peptidoglycan/xylan/chitin deacetylase (PgdA/CDA1 family)
MAKYVIMLNSKSIFSPQSAVRSPQSAVRSPQLSNKHLFLLKNSRDGLLWQNLVPTVIKIAIFLLVVDVTNVIVATEINDPEDFVRYFYSLLPTQCEEALRIRPSYTLEQCRKTEKVTVINTELVEHRTTLARLTVTVNYRKQGIEVNDATGCVTLMKQNDDWWMFGSWKGGRCTNQNTANNRIEAATSSTIHKKLSPLPAGSEIFIPHTFSNRTYLDNQSSQQQCWSATELRGSPGERKIRKLSIPDPGTMDSTSIASAKQYLRQQQWFAPKNSIRFVNVNGSKPIAITFDLCERANEISGYDAAIVNYLRDNNIKATFYIGGKWMQSHKERTMQLMADPLFEIGNHAWTHGNLRVLQGQRMLDQILWTQAQYYKIRQELEYMSCLSQQTRDRIPWQPATFRFPYGTCSTESLDTLHNLGLAAIQWSIVTGDPGRGQTAQGIAHTVLTLAKPGAIIIAHANGRGHGTAQSLPMFIPKLLARGFEFVTVSELLSLGEPYATSECFELKKGDNKRYDKIFGKGTGE